MYTDFLQMWTTNYINYLEAYRPRKKDPEDARNTKEYHERALVYYKMLAASPEVTVLNADANTPELVNLKIEYHTRRLGEFI